MSILKKIKTQDNLQRLHQQLSTIILNLSGKEGRLEEIVNESTDFAPAILDYLKDKQAFSKEDAIRELRSLGEQYERIESVELVLAFTPTEEFVDKLLDWVLENVGDAVLQIGKNPILVGGATITYKGRYMDLSTSKKLKVVFEGLQSKKDDRY